MGELIVEVIGELAIHGSGVLIRKVFFPSKPLKELMKDDYSNLGCGLVFWTVIITGLIYLL